MISMDFAPGPFTPDPWVPRPQQKDTKTSKESKGSPGDVRRLAAEQALPGDFRRSP